MNYKNNNKLFNAVVLISILLTTVLFYSLPIQSPFIFDDFYNLSGLGEVKDKGYVYFLLNNSFAGPTGRPVSLLSFAIQHEAWPYNPHLFKTGNLIIHLLNGVFIWLICDQLLRHRQNSHFHKLLITALTTAIWLLHPMQLTTVLYTVQRMTQLACLFSLIAIWGYLLTRIYVVRKESRFSYILLGIVVIAPTILGVLSKENAILVLPLIAIIEFTLLQAVYKPQFWRSWAIIVLGLPVLILCVYLASKFSITSNSFHFRDFTMLERLMTQPVILLNYLKDMFLPVYGSYTIYHDDWAVSRGLLNPWYTLPAILIMLLLPVVAIWQRKKQVIISFAILWFITAHLLESSYLNLELYFEHRNYLPSIAIYFALANGLVWLLCKIRNNYIQALLPSLYILLIVSTLFLESTLWHKPLLQASEWARIRPTSMRSLNYLGNLYLNIKEYDQSNKVYENMQNVSPDIFFPVLQQQRITSCKSPIESSRENWNKVFEKAASAKPIGLEMVALLDIFLLEILKGQCRSDTLQNFEILLNNLVDNRRFVFIRTYLYEFLAITSMQKGDYSAALTYIDYSILAEDRIEAQMFRIKMLEHMNRPDMIIRTFQALEKKAGNNPVKIMKLQQIKNEYHQP